MSLLSGPQLYERSLTSAPALKHQPGENMKLYDSEQFLEGTKGLLEHYF